MIINNKFLSQQGKATLVPYPKQGHTLTSRTPPSKDNYFIHTSLTKEKNFDKRKQLHKCHYSIDTRVGTPREKGKNPCRSNVEKNVGTPLTYHPD